MSLTQPRIIGSKAPFVAPQGTPPDIWDRFVKRELSIGLNIIDGTPPWGRYLVFVYPHYQGFEISREFPSDFQFYLQRLGGSESKARLYFNTCRQHNKDMLYYLLEKRLSIKQAKREITREYDETAKVMLQLAAQALSAASTGLSSHIVRSNAETIVDTVKYGNFVKGVVSGGQNGGAEVVELSDKEYREALSLVFPSSALDPVKTLIEDIGMRAARTCINDQRFLDYLKDSKTIVQAGRLFHEAADKAIKALPLRPSGLPPGWKISSEETIKGGKGGSRLDILFRGPAGEVVEIDWKTTGESAFTSRSIAQMDKHKGHLGSIWIKGQHTIRSQESRSWIDYVRAAFAEATFGKQSGP